MTLLSLTYFNQFTLIIRRFSLMIVFIICMTGCERREADWPEGEQITVAPQQRNLPEQEGWPYMGATVTPVAEFSLEARVLSAQRYSHPPTGPIMPIDLALGWGPMSDTQIINQIDISQGQRRYYFRWPEDFTGNHHTIIFNSANMHLIAGNPDVEQTFDRIRANQHVLIEGYLVNVRIPDYGHLRTSQRRDDTGDGSCEIIWVERLEIIQNP